MPHRFPSAGSGSPCAGRSRLRSGPRNRPRHIGRQLAYKPGSVWRRCRRATAIHLGRPLPDVSRNLPGWQARKRAWSRNPAPSLFGLAPGGVYRAVPVTGPAVGSYPTLSPLPLGLRRWAVCFLWHFPWGRPRRALPGTVFPWSPDFPPPRPFGPCGSDHPASWRMGR